MDFRRHPGRPRKDESPAPTKRRVVKVPEAMDDALEAAAKRREISVQQAIREAITLWLGAQG